MTDYSLSHVIPITHNQDYILIDMDTGTVLGNNVVAVDTTYISESTLSYADSSEDYAWLLGHKQGKTLYVKEA